MRFILWECLIFQSTRPSRGATDAAGEKLTGGEISIHAPLAGRDVGVSKDTIRRLLISIHAPLAGRDSRRDSNSI